MATSIGKAALVLSTNNAGLKSGLNEAAAEVRGWRSRVGSTLSKGGGFLKTALLGGLAGGIGGIVAGAAMSGLGSLGSQFADIGAKADNAAKMARRLGTSTEGFQGLEHAAGLSGVGVGQLQTALVKFRQNVDGPLDDALYGMADRLTGITDPGEKARIAVEMFGRQGVQMLTMFEGGSKGLKAMTGEVRELGTALSNADAGKIETANDALSRITTSIKGLFQRIIVAAAPVLTFWSERLTGAIKMVRPIVDWVGRGFEALYRVWDGVFAEVSALVGELWAEFSGWAGDVFDFAGEWPSIGDVITGTLKYIGIGLAYLWDTFEVGAKVASDVVGAIVILLADLLESNKEAARGLIELAEELGGVFGTALVTTDAKNKLDEIGADWRKLGEAMRENGRDPLGGWGQSAGRVSAWFDRLGQKSADVGQKVRDDVEETEQSAARIGSVFAAALSKGQPRGVQCPREVPVRRACRQERPAAGRAAEGQRPARRHLGRDQGYGGQARHRRRRLTGLHSGMSVTATVTELMDGRTSELADDGTRTAKRQFRITLDLTSATPTEKAGAEAFAEAALPVARYASHPAWPVALARTVGLTRGKNHTDWLAEVGYSSALFAANSDGSGGAAGTGGNGTSPGTANDKTTPADQRPPEVRAKRAEYQEVLEKDADTGDDVVNAAGDPFDPPIMTTRSRMQLEVKVFRAAAGFNFGTKAALWDHINSDVITLFGMTFPVKTLRVVDIGTGTVWDTGDAGLSLFFELNYLLEYKADTWVRQVLNQGKREYLGDGGEPQIITDDSGQPVSDPVPLHPTGRRLEHGEDLDYIAVNEYPSASLAGLFL